MPNKLAPGSYGQSASNEHEFVITCWWKRTEIFGPLPPSNSALWAQEVRHTCSLVKVEVAGGSWFTLQQFWGIPSPLFLAMRLPDFLKHHLPYLGPWCRDSWWTQTSLRAVGWQMGPGPKKGQAAAAMSQHTFFFWRLDWAIKESFLFSCSPDWWRYMEGLK